MKRKTVSIVLLLMLAALPGVTQKSVRQAIREQKRVEREQAVNSLVVGKTFEFRGTRAIPTGYKSVDLATNPNFIRFSPDLIVSEMPYFGTAYSVPFGGEGGMKFEGKPEIFTIEKRRNNFYVEAKVKSNEDYFVISLTISLEGNSSLSLISNNRAPISYNGAIFPLADSGAAK